MGRGAAPTQQLQACSGAAELQRRAMARLVLHMMLRILLLLLLLLLEEETLLCQAVCGVDPQALTLSQEHLLERQLLRHLDFQRSSLIPSLVHGPHQCPSPSALLLYLLLLFLNGLCRLKDLALKVSHVIHFLQA